MNKHKAGFETAKAGTEYHQRLGVAVDKESIRFFLRLKAHQLNEDSIKFFGKPYNELNLEQSLLVDDVYRERG